LSSSVKEDVAWLQSHPMLRKDLAPKIKGFLYDIKTGSPDEIV